MNTAKPKTPLKPAALAYKKKNEQSALFLVWYASQIAFGGFLAV